MENFLNRVDEIEWNGGRIKWNGMDGIGYKIAQHTIDYNILE